jgi:hypothetical protein
LRFTPRRGAGICRNRALGRRLDWPARRATGLRRRAQRPDGHRRRRHAGGRRARDRRDPEALVEKEWAHTGCTELHIVDTMHERKRIMAEHADAFLSLPGGIGTLEEFFEVWTWRQLGYHAKPVGLLNLNGYYSDLLAFLASSVKSGFMSDWQMELIHVGSEPEALLQELVQVAGMAPEGQRLDQI